MHGLVYLAEPPWRGIVEASTSSFPKDESMEPNETIGNQDEDIVGTSANPGESNLGLG